MSLRRTPFVACLAALITTAPSLVAVALALPASALILESEFYPISTDRQAYAAVAGDWNEDGIADLAVLNESPPSLGIYLGAGSFSFLSPDEVGLSASPFWLASRDLNGDGHLDLVVTGDFGTTFYLGLGNGTFSAETTIAYPGRYVAIADLDGDARDDIVLTQHGAIVTLLGAGEFQFSVDSIASNEASLRLGDFNHDGRADIVTAEFGGLAVRLNYGAGAFGPPTVYSGSCGPSTVWSCVAAGDLDADGHPDIVGVSSDPDGCAPVWFGLGDGTFELHSSAPERSDLRTAASIPAGSHFALLEDLNGDSRAERIELTHNEGYEVACASSVNSTLPRRFRSLPAPSSATTADVDGDGILDLIVAGFDGMAIHPGLADGTLRRNTGNRAMSPMMLSEIADLNGDGLKDLIVLETERVDVAAALGTVDGSFGPPLATPGAVNVGRAVADVDEDGHQDIVLGGRVFPGFGDGTFGEPGHLYSSSRIPSLAAGNLNSDAHVDLVVVRNGFANAAVYAGNGDGTFGSGSEVPIAALEVRLADLDNDGRLDLVARVAGGITVAYGDGVGSFLDATNLSGATAWPVGFGDVDGDGQSDIVMSGAVFRSVGRNFIRLDAPFDGPPALGDLDLDGNLDVVIGRTGTVWTGNGDGTFGPGKRFGPFGEILIDDRDADGTPDLVIIRTDSRDRQEASATIVFNRTGRGSTAVLVTSFSAIRVPEGVRLMWQIADDLMSSRAFVERADRSSGPWAEVGLGRSNDGDVFVQVDMDASSDRSYWYRLAFISNGASTPIGSPVEVMAAMRTGFSLSSVSPNPSSGSLRIDFAAPKEAEVALDVFDVLGRRIALLMRNKVQAGAHTLQWPWQSGGKTTPAGLYLLRYQYPGGQSTRWISHSN